MIADSPTRAFLFTSILSLVLAHSALAGPQGSFMGLGDLPGGNFKSHALGVSGDGSTVVGWGSSPTGMKSFRWRSSIGMVALAGPVSGTIGGKAYDASYTGSVIVGQAAGNLGPGQPGDLAYRWTATTGAVPIGAFPRDQRLLSSAHAVSANGSVVAGNSQHGDGSYEPFRWSAATGFVGLGDVPGGMGLSNATGMSADGSIIVGHAFSPLAVEAFRWTADSGMQVFHDYTLDGFIAKSATAISADGSTIVGHGTPRVGGPNEAFLWTEAGGLQRLGDLPGGAVGAGAWGVSGDGSVVVGQSITGPVAHEDYEAFVWTPASGMMLLQGILENDHGLDLTGWKLVRANAVSDDGTVIVGYGINPAGNEEAFRAVIPEPASMSFLALALLLTRSRRRRPSTAA